MGKLYVLIGKSGAGKDYVLNKVLDANPQYKRAIRYTTRPKRDGEIDGVNYHFVTDEDYEHFKKSDMIVEEEKFKVADGSVWTYFTAIDGSIDFFSDNVYLTSASAAPACNAIIDKLGEDVVIPIHIMASDKTRLYRCLERDSNVLEICRRFLSDEEYFSTVSEWILSKHVVFNDEFSDDPVSRVEIVIRNTLKI